MSQFAAQPTVERGAEFGAAPMPDELLYGVDGTIATITLNAPQRMNTISGPMLDLLAKTLVDVDNNPDVRVVILTGEALRRENAQAPCSPYQGMALEFSSAVARASAASAVAAESEDCSSSRSAVRAAAEASAASARAVAEAGGVAMRNNHPSLARPEQPRNQPRVDRLSC